MRFGNSQILAISYTISLLISAHLTLTITTLSFVILRNEETEKQGQVITLPKATQQGLRGAGVGAPPRGPESMLLTY